MRRCLLCGFLRRSGLKNSNSRGKETLVFFPFAFGKEADSSCFRNWEADISALTEVRQCDPFSGACFDIPCTRRLDTTLTDFHNGGKIPWHF